jgi:hypothetical protein
MVSGLMKKTPMLLEILILTRLTCIDGWREYFCKIIALHCYDGVKRVQLTVPEINTHQQSIGKDTMSQNLVHSTIEMHERFIHQQSDLRML